jgi:hypothetical protein
MSPITKLVTQVEAVKNKFGLDNTDLLILATLSEKWDEGKYVRVTDLTKKFNEGVGSSASIHYRLTTDLVKLGIVALQINEEDARVKFIVKGKQFNTLQKYVGNLWKP